MSGSYPGSSRGGATLSYRVTNLGDVDLAALTLKILVASIREEPQCRP